MSRKKLPAPTDARILPLYRLRTKCGMTLPEIQKLLVEMGCPVSYGTVKKWLEGKSPGILPSGLLAKCLKGLNAKTKTK